MRIFMSGPVPRYTPPARTLVLAAMASIATQLNLAEAAGPGQVGAAAAGGDELEGTVVALGAAAHAGQAAGAGGGADAAAVVDDVEDDQPVLLRQGDPDGGGVSMACAVGQGLAGNGEDVVGQVCVRVRV